ncbi:Flp pilus assembly protein CpaB [Vibrio porteresiae]|uniref:Flp pilus assembly protein CpaB n=1 Tax=Vibrio porteresiae DSM 19223 TaxID=1123496 RepID=A0ABZ0QM22_9VIBR|nr:Flp pilus assembly protein CpaB [Vibrio porteresiae]WPC76456.1 Flp pilus assembly protein CpaB [Vibrio porteresiae DSM 19223]
MNIKVVTLIAVLAIFSGGYGLTHQSTAKPEKQVEQKEQEQLIQVYLAKHDLAKGEPLSRSDVVVEKWKQAKANQFGIDKDQSLAFKTGQLVRAPVLAGAVIYPENIISQEDSDYVDFIIQPNRIAFPLETTNDAIVGGVIRANSHIDVLALTSTAQNLANDRSINSYKGVSLAPILMNIKVLKVATEKVKENKEEREKTSLILELTPKQVSTLTIAKRIAQLEVHQTVKNATAKDLSANSGDVMGTYHAITEFRAGNSSVK